jgi:hypothetical protein
MKALLILFTVFVFNGLNVKAHDKITFKTKESFNQACEKGKFCTTFDLVKIEDNGNLSEAGKFIEQNSSLFQYTLEGTIINLHVLSNAPEKIIYEKLFYVMGLFEIEILEGDSKGTYSVEEFLNLYQF